MAFHDARSLRDGEVLDADVCVVGAGAAGIVIALALGGKGRRVCVLESGGFHRGDVHQQLYRGRRVGLAYPPLQNTRLRFFGGTTNHWAGWCRPPRREDFAARPWIPDSGWPLAFDELAPYLGAAQSVCDLAPHGFDADDWRGEEVPLALDPGAFHTIVTRFSPPTRFADKYDAAIAQSPNVRVYLHANVTGIAGPGGRVDHLRCRTLEGGAFKVTARRVVLATGGIENARLLLASAIAGHGDVVGRYFMDHFKYRVGVFEPAPGVSLGFYQRARRKGSELKGVLGFDESVLRREAMTPAHFEFRPYHGDGPPRYRVDLRLDPAPNRDSRVTLDRVTDRLSVPRVRLELRYGALETHTFNTAVRLLRDALDDAGLGMLRVDDRALAAAPVTATGFHHMGATRMSDDPVTGVVDRDCRVHGVDNLYVAGCSVFPGYEGYPTMTLVALALRLADHLAG